MYLFPTVVGASATLLFGYALLTVLRRGDAIFRETQQMARRMPVTIVLPVWAIKLLFYPCMVGMLFWGAYILLVVGLELW